MATITLYRKSKRQPCYRLSYRDPQTGKWRNKLLHCAKDQADQIRKDVEAEFTWLDTHPEKRNSNSPKSLSVKNTINAFIKSKRGTVEASTVARYKVALDNFSDFYEGDVDKIDRHIMDSYRTLLLEGRKETVNRDPLKKREGRGANAELRHIKVWLKYCSESGWLVMPKINFAKEKPIVIRWLTKDQVKSMQGFISELPEGEREITEDIFNLLLQTGARVNEIIEVQWSQINLSRKQIKPKDKGNTGKALYLDKRSVQILRKYKDVQPGPFRVNDDWFDWRFRKLAKLAGIKTKVHDLRRTCGAWLIQSGVDIYQVSKYLRHSSVVVTEKHYIDILPSDMSGIANKMSQQMADIF